MRKGAREPTTSATPRQPLPQDLRGKYCEELTKAATVVTIVSTTKIVLFKVLLVTVQGPKCFT